MFQAFADRKTRAAASAHIECLAAVLDEPNRPCTMGIGNEWSRAHYGGDFGLLAPRRDQTALSLVFIQTSDGNTAGRDPGTFGGGATDTHLLYEGLSRVAADAVLAGAGSLHRTAFFSVWRPELVSLRLSLGLPRHPAQVIVSKRGRFDFNALLFNVADVPVFLLAGDECVRQHQAALAARPWIRIIATNSDDLRPVIDRLRIAEGIQRISAIGGRRTATRLVDSGLAQDIYLTTTSRSGGESGTPWYSGAASPRLTRITAKKWTENALPVVFEHFLIGGWS
jgi:riboflavin biosynthesis pyrimidine reductase